jgi:hypothetical protein
MWDPQRVIALLASTACYRVILFRQNFDSFFILASLRSGKTSTASEFSIDVYMYCLFAVFKYGLCGADSASNRNEYQKQKNISGD